MTIKFDKVEITGDFAVKGNRSAKGFSKIIAERKAKEEEAKRLADKIMGTALSEAVEQLRQAARECDREGKRAINPITKVVMASKSIAFNEAADGIARGSVFGIEP